MSILQALGNLGEFIGAVGVVISLIYLAQQLNHNSKAVKASSFNSMIQNSLRLLEHQFRDKELAQFLAQAEKHPEELDETGNFRWDSYMMAVYRHFGNLVYQHRVGALDEKMWQSYQADLKQALRAPSWREWFARNRAVLSTPLQDEVTSLVLELKQQGLIPEDTPLPEETPLREETPLLADVSQLPED